MPEKSTRTQSVVPYLVYEDTPKALDFLCKTFGFKELTRVSREDGTIMHAEVEHEGNVIMLGTPVDKNGRVKNLKLPANAPQRYSTMCYVADVRGHYAHAKAAGANITIEPQERSHGEEMYAAVDPEGHAWYFSTYHGG
jgi:uncharacterized glyoxalase superfamily protein PhnB